MSLDDAPLPRQMQLCFGGNRNRPSHLSLRRFAIDLIHHRLGDSSDAHLNPSPLSRTSRTTQLSGFLLGISEIFFAKCFVGCVTIFSHRQPSSRPLPRVGASPFPESSPSRLPPMLPSVNPTSRSCRGPSLRRVDGIHLHLPGAPIPSQRRRPISGLTVTPSWLERRLRMLPTTWSSITILCAHPSTDSPSLFLQCPLSLQCPSFPSKPVSAFHKSFMSSERAATCPCTLILVSISVPLVWPRQRPIAHPSWPSIVWYCKTLEPSHSLGPLATPMPL